MDPSLPQARPIPVPGRLAPGRIALVLLLLGALLVPVDAQPSGRKRGIFSSRFKKDEPAPVPAQPAPLSWAHPQPREGLVVDAITFALAPGRVYVPLNDVAYHLGRGYRYDANRDVVRLPGRTLAGSAVRRLTDGTVLVSLRDLEAAGVPVSRARGGKSFNIGDVDRFFTAAVYPKRVLVDLNSQRLRGWQGNRQVIECRVSSGKNRGSTPTGSFYAGPYKKALHLSSLYDNAPMPFSVQVTGHVFIHGYSYVPHFPASHGCIRLPLNEGNPAKFFYEWIDKGAPVRVQYGSSKPPAVASRAPSPPPPPPPAAPKARRPSPQPEAQEKNESPNTSRIQLFRSTSRKKPGETEYLGKPAPPKPVTRTTAAPPSAKPRPQEKARAKAKEKQAEKEKKLAANRSRKEPPRSQEPISIRFRSF